MNERPRPNEISVDIAKQNMEAFNTSPELFIRSVARRMSLQNHRLLDRHLAASASTSLVGSHEEGSLFMWGGAYQYSCIADSYEKIGGNVPFVTEDTYQTAAEQDAWIFIDLVASGGRDKEVIDYNKKRLLSANKASADLLIREYEKYYQFLGPRASAFLAGALSINSTFDITPANEPYQADSEQLVPSLIPQVRRQIVRDAMVSDFLGRDDLMSQTAERLSNFSPDMIERLNSVHEFSLVSPEVYSFFSLFELHCLMEEYERRTLPFPQIRLHHIQKQDDDVRNAVKSGDLGKVNEAYEAFQERVMTDIQRNNPNLFWGISCYADGIANSNKRGEADAALNGIIQPYYTVRVAVEEALGSS